MIITIMLWLGMFQKGCFVINEHVFCSSIEITAGGIPQCQCPPTSTKPVIFIEPNVLKNNWLP